MLNPRLIAVLQQLLLEILFFIGYLNRNLDQPIEYQADVVIPGYPNFDQYITFKDNQKNPVKKKQKE